MKFRNVALTLLAGLLSQVAMGQGQGQGGPPVQDVNVVNVPLPVAETTIEPFLVSERLQVKTNNPFDDFQFVIEVPEGKIIIVEYVSASVGGAVQQDEEFELTVSGSAVVTGLGTQRPRHHVVKLTRFERLSRSGIQYIQHAGGGLVTTYGMSSLNIAVTSNIAVGDFQSDPRELFADIQLSGLLVDAD